MKRTLTIMMACVWLALLGGSAHAASIDLGLCDGLLGTTGESKTGSGTIEVAIKLQASEFAHYQGASLSGMRVGLVMADGITHVKAWVRTSLDGENLCTATIANPVAGWNEAQLDAPCDYLLQADQDIYIGYQFDQSRSTRCIALAGRHTDDCYWLARNGNWSNNSAAAYGAACVELTVEGSMVPALNLAIESCTYQRLIPYGEPFEAELVVRNCAKTTVQSYTCQYQPTPAEVLEEVVREGVNLKYRERDTLHLVMGADLQAPDEVRYEVPVSIWADGDGIADDDHCVLYRSNYTQSYPHLLLMEEFTTEECPNCPRAINTLSQMVNEGYRFAQISHHVGYKTDFLTEEEDKTYLWLYGPDGTFAPAGMFDRTYDEAFQVISPRPYPVFSIGYADDFRPALEAALALPAFVGLTPALQYDETTRQLSIDVAIEKATTLDALCQEPRLTVILIEDSIPAIHQAGISSTTFCHRHVYRKCLTEMWGDPIAWDEDNASTAHLEFILPSDWNAEKVEVVAFVNNYNPSDRNDCCIYNTATASIAHAGEEGLYTLPADTPTPRYYNLLGQPVRNPLPNQLLIHRIK